MKKQTSEVRLVLYESHISHIVAIYCLENFTKASFPQIYDKDRHSGLDRIRLGYQLPKILK